MENLVKSSPETFVAYLKEKNIHRFYFIYDEEKKSIAASHPELNEIVKFLESDKRDYEQHEGVFFELMPEYDSLLGAFIHKTCRGQGAGGTRFWSYDTVEEFFRDGLRLSKGMTHKNALAGLWWGGGKGIIVDSPKIDKQNPEVRKKIFQAYGVFITSLAGCYITAEDVGTTPTDISNIFSKTRFVTCIPPSLGGSGNPSTATARGVISGMEAALNFAANSNLEGKTIAVQGMGHVGMELIRFLFEKKVKKVIACDIHEQAVKKAKAEFPGQELEAFFAPKNDQKIFEVSCDIFAPCATGGIINPKTIEKLQTKIICGAANNQLEDAQRDDQLLRSKDILYVPDFLVNRMGIVNCSNEQYGYIGADPFFERHLTKDWEYSVYQMTLKVLEKAKKDGTPPGTAAVKLASDLAKEEHPIFGHRALKIIQSIVKKEWHKAL